MTTTPPRTITWIHCRPFSEDELASVASLALPISEWPAYPGPDAPDSELETVVQVGKS